MILRITIVLIIITNIGYAQTSEALEGENTIQSHSYCIELIRNNRLEDAEVVIRDKINSIESNDEKASFCYLIAKTYNNNLFYTLSLAYAKEGIDYLDASSSLNIALNHVIIINHIDLKNYDLAETHYWKLEKLDSFKEDSKANKYNLIGEIYRLKGDYDKSILFYHRAIEVNTNNSNKVALATNYNLSLIHI